MEYGFVAVDAIRPHLHAVKEIEPWYRYNTLLYVRSSTLNELSETMQQYIVPEKEPLKDFSPPLYRIRKQMVRCFPVGLATGIAKVKEKLTMWKVLRRKRQEASPS